MAIKRITREHAAIAVAIIESIVEQVYGDEYKIATQINLHPSYGKEMFDLVQSMKEPA